MLATLYLSVSDEANPCVLLVPRTYGLNIGLLDPPGYHRVRVKMRLKKEGNEHSFELLEILANHWYGDDVAESGADKEG